VSTALCIGYFLNGIWEKAQPNEEINLFFKSLKPQQEPQARLMRKFVIGKNWNHNLISGQVPGGFNTGKIKKSRIFKKTQKKVDIR
jgi:hypothetical protein